MGQTDSKTRIKAKPGATVESAQDHLRDVKTLQSHVQQQVRDKTAAIFELRRKGASKTMLKAAIARLRPHQAQLNHLSTCVERLEASVIGIETHRLNRKTMAVMKNLTKFGTMTEREMEEAVGVLDEVDVVSQQHDELAHIVHQAGAAMAGQDTDDPDADEVDLFFQLNDPDYCPRAPEPESKPGSNPNPARAEPVLPAVPLVEATVINPASTSAGNILVSQPL